MTLPAQTHELVASASGNGERRQITVLFADMEGYTTLSETLGEEDTYRIMQPVLSRMVETIHAHGGTTQDLAGDGVMALFGAPHAIENAPLRACEAALDMHLRLADLVETIRLEHGVAPRFRVGLNAGPVVLGHMGEGKRIEFRAVGDTVNLAARLQSLAEPGTVLLFEDMHRRVGGYVDDTVLGLRSIKGKAGPVRVYRLDAVHTTPAPTDSRARCSGVWAHASGANPNSPDSRPDGRQRARAAPGPCA